MKFTRWTYIVAIYRKWKVVRHLSHVIDDYEMYWTLRVRALREGKHL